MEKALFIIFLLFLGIQNLILVYRISKLESMFQIILTALEEAMENNDIDD